VDQLLQKGKWNLIQKQKVIIVIFGFNSCLAKKHNIRLSKAMSYLLRHGAYEAGLHMSDDGFIKIADLMESPSVKKCKPKFSDILD